MQKVAQAWQKGSRDEQGTADSAAVREGNKQRRKQRQAAWEECGDTAWVCRDGAAKVQINLELKLARHAETYKKGFFYICWQPRKIWVHQLNGAGDLEKKKTCTRVADWIKKTKVSVKMLTFLFVVLLFSKLILILFVAKLKNEWFQIILAYCIFLTHSKHLFKSIQDYTCCPLHLNSSMPSIN